MLPTMSPILTNQESRVGANDTVIITFVLDGGVLDARLHSWSLIHTYRLDIILGICHLVYTNSICQIFKWFSG
eukprot:COSAG02_NODE_913_length_15994_cov_6.140484_10_plen_73_part_00